MSSLRLAYKDELFLSFAYLLKRNKSMSIYQKTYKSLRRRSMRKNMILGLKLWKIFPPFHKNHTIWEMIQKYKDGETVQCILEHKA